MKNPTPGKNPFELASYVDKMPPVIRDPYLDMTIGYTDFGGRTGRARFYRFWIFTVLYLAVLMWISDTATDTVLVFLGLLICGWLYIAVPSAAISVRRLHDANKSALWAWMPQILIFYCLAEFAMMQSYNWFIWAPLGALTAVSFGVMSLPSFPEDNRWGKYNGSGEDK